jgi:aminoglycoside phosphotransferase (APT) family kinase protein
MTMTSTPPGIPSTVRLAGWISQSLGGGEPVELTDVQLIAGGRSNLTYRLTLSGSGAGPNVGPGSGAERVLVLRRPPLGHVLPTAHDMSREFRVLSGLAGTEVPVATPVAFCDDAEIIGAPFYLMENVTGMVLRSRTDTAALTESQNADLSERLADMLAAIHGVDVEATGLTGLGRGAGYLTRQLARWQRQAELSRTREIPGYDQLVDRLAPAKGASGSPRPAAEGRQAPAPRSRQARARRPALAGPCRSASACRAM